MTEKELIQILRKYESGIVYDDGSYSKILEEKYFEQIAKDIIKKFSN
jgi:hypothetical protein